jgi:hypothetical protein
MPVIKCISGLRTRIIETASKTMSYNEAAILESYNTLLAALPLPRHALRGAFGHRYLPSVLSLHDDKYNSLEGKFRIAWP